MRPRARWFLPCVVWGLLGAGSSFAAEARVDHSLWEALLRRSVVDGKVDYQGMAEARDALDQYTASLTGIQPEQLASREEQLAFWINAYNATITVAVLTHAPLRSVKDVPGFFNRERHRVGGQDLTLDEIERAAHRLRDWRSHMAVVCASAGCPPLRSEAYLPERLEEQLVDQTQRYLADSARGLRIEGATLWLSHIFTWAAADIVPRAPRGWMGPRLRVEDLLPVLGPYLTPEGRERLRRGRVTIRFIPYDWSLNHQRRRDDAS